MRTYKPRPCKCPCGREFMPTGPRDVYATPSCKTAAARLRRAEQAARADLPPLGRALADVTLVMRSRAAPYDLSLTGLAQIVRSVVRGNRDKDRPVYATAVAELAGWALSELARVRPDDDATAS